MRPAPSWSREHPHYLQELGEKYNIKRTAEIRLGRLQTRGVGHLPFPLAARAELTDEQRYLRMPAKHGRRWKTIANLDSEIERIQGEQERLRTETEMLNARLPAAEQADVQALANWHENGRQGSRPEPSKDALDLELERLAQDQTALDRLIDELLDKKEQHVRHHRRRLEKEAGADVERAHERYSTLVRELERARDELLEARRTRRWAQLFPEETANGDDLLTVHVAGGLLEPVKRTLGTNAQVPFQSFAAALRADADVLRDGLPRVDHDGLNLRREAIWENTDEGQRALNDEKHRIREGMKPQNVTRAGWET